MSIEYKNGQFDGPQLTFYSDGSLKSEATYKDGKLQGKKKTYAEKQKPLTDKKEGDVKKEKEKETKVKSNDLNKGVKKP